MLSIDNLVVGFALGSTHTSILAGALVIGAVSVVASLAGLELGARIGARAGKRGEQLRRPDADRDRRRDRFRRARLAASSAGQLGQLGYEIVGVHSTDPTDEVVALAAAKPVTV